MGVLIVRRYGNYVNWVFDSDESIRQFIIKSVRPTDEYREARITESNRDTGGPLMIHGSTGILECMQIARKQGYTFTKKR